jgi:hypothetical protein
VKTALGTLAMLSARRTLSTNRAVPKLNRCEQLAMSPTPTITDAPLNATSVAGDAADGGVRSTAGLQSKTSNATSNATSGPMDCLYRMTVPVFATTAVAQKFRPSPSLNPV